jgi:hypothetical protein
MDKSKIIKTVIVVAVLLTIVAVFIVILNTQQDHQITATSQAVTIKAPYGQQVSTSDIQNIKLLNEVPLMDNKVNGSDTNISLNGTFNMKGYGTGSCYLAQRNEGPCILLQLKDGYVLINETTPEKTRALYDSLSVLGK